MDSRFLESFMTVIDSGSIAEAARRLNLTPAGVAQRIHALEAEIGAPLLSRSGRSVLPTPAGTAILSRARNILSEVRDLKSIATSDRLSGELRLGATPTSLTGILPRILALLTRKYPHIDIWMMGANSRALYDGVLRGDFDAVIIGQPPFAIPKAYDWRILREEPLVVLTQASCRVQDPHAILASRPFIGQSRDSWVGRLVYSYLRAAGIRPHQRFEMDTPEATAVMVDQGLGVALVHDWSPPWPAGLSLRKIPLPPNRFGRRMGLVWNRASVRIRLVHALLEAAELASATGQTAKPGPKGSDFPSRRRKAKSTSA
jgi:DNA-binding transcriptional LysR family regulator